ncbi:MAG: hypothetical protein WAR24_16700, partial [Candidatus Acidiferrales bacterium]
TIYPRVTFFNGLTRATAQYSAPGVSASHGESQSQAAALPTHSLDTVPTFIEDRVGPFFAERACIMLIADAT